MQVFYKVSGDNNFCWRPSEKNALKKFLSHRLPWQTMQPIWKKDFIQKLGGFDVEFQRMQDVELHTRALLASPQFKCIDSQPDCYYRIDEERKNFAAYNFLERWVDSAVKYCNKFAPLVEDSLIKYLWGTTMATRLQLYYYLREKRINVAEYSSLKEKLGKQNLFRQMDGYHKFILSLSEMYNIRSVKIPGINWLLSKLFVL